MTNIQNIDLSNLPSLLRENALGVLSRSDIKFEPLQVDSRTYAEISWLFRPEEAHGSGAALIRYLPGGQAPLHLHTSFELIYMLDGEMITTQGTVKKNDLILLPPGSRHASRSETGCLALIIWNQPVKLIADDMVTTSATFDKS